MLERVCRRERDFHGSLAKALGDSSVPVYPLVVTVGAPGGTTSLQVEAINAFDTLHVAYKHPDYFQKIVFGHYSSSVLTQYWEHMKETSWGEHGDVFLDAQLWSKRSMMVPTVWHSDAGELFNDAGWIAYNLCTPFTYDIDPRDSRLFALALEEKLVIPETERDVTIYIKWVQAVLQSGVFPFKDHNKNDIGEPWASKAGQQIAGGFCWSFSAWTGDLKAGPHNNYK